MIELVELDAYQALRQQAALMRLQQRTTIRLSGKDRALVLHNLCTADINRLKPGEGCEAFITSIKGKAIGLVQVFCQSESLLIDTVGGEAEKLIAHMDRYVLREDAKFEDLSASYQSLLISGPKSADVIHSLARNPDLLPTKTLAHEDAVIGSCEVHVARVNWTGPDDWLLRVAQDDADRLCLQFGEAGLKICAADLFEVARIEYGMPLYGIDITDANLPQEVNRNELAISFRKGCYLGQETIARLDALGHVNKIFSGVAFAERVDIQPGMAWQVEGKDVGSITSVCQSPQFHAVLTLGYLKPALAKPGTKIDCQGTTGVVVLLGKQEPN
jgi:folate-binding protein YgfZ